LCLDAQFAWEVGIDAVRDELHSGVAANCIRMYAATLLPVWPERDPLIWHDFGLNWLDDLCLRLRRRCCVMTCRNEPNGWSAMVTCAAAGLLMFCLSAQALIKVEYPVSRIHRESNVVRSGTIVAVDAGRGVVEVKPAETFKGGPAPERFGIVVTTPAEVIKRVAVGQPVAVFLVKSESEGAAIVHLADTWLLAQAVPNAKIPTLNVVQSYDGARSFPGRTASLVRLLAAMKAGQSPLEDKLDPECLAGKARAIANLGVKATFLETGDVNGDSRPDLLAGTADGVRLFLGAEPAYTNATEAWGLKNLKAEHVAVGDLNGDGQADLLLGANVMVRSGDGFVRLEPALELPPEAGWLDAAVADVTGDQKADVVVLLNTGELVQFRNPGVAGKPWTRVSRKLWEGGEAAAARFSAGWGENAQLYAMVVRGDGIIRHAVAVEGEPPTPFVQLTGTAWPAKLTPAAGAPAWVKCAALDCDGNGKPDFVALVPGGGVTLLNRGFGAFYVDYTIHAKIRPEDSKAQPFVVGPGSFLAGGPLQRGKPARQNLLVLTEDGRVYDVPNTVLNLR